MRYVFLLIVIGASVGTFFLVVKPKYDSLRSVKTEVGTYDTSLETAEQLRISREELIAKYNSIPKTDLDSIKTLLPDSVDNIRLIIQLDSLATKNNLAVLRSVEYQNEAIAPNATDQASIDSAQKPYGEFTISFQTSGQYTNFLSFLSDLEQNLRLVDITSVSFSAANAEGASAANALSYKVTLKTYWLKK